MGRADYDEEFCFRVAPDKTISSVSCTRQSSMHSVFICKQCTNIRNNNTQENDHRVCVNEDSLFSSPSGRVVNLQTVGFARPLYKYLAFISFCVLASILTGALILFLKRHRRTRTRELQLGAGASGEKIELYESNETPSPLTNTRRPDSSVYEYDCCATENVPVAGRPKKARPKHSMPLEMASSRTRHMNMSNPRLQVPRPLMQPP